MSLFFRNAASKTAQHVSSWYGIDAGFADVLLQFFLGGADASGEHGSVQALLDAHEPKRVQLEYAFSTNVRGNALAEALVARGMASRDGRQKTYLDIGCAYGGFLLAFSKLGYRTRGVEFVPELAELGRRHLESAGIRGEVVEGDFLDEKVIREEPAYDLVTCNDVIEHVSDPARCLRKIYGLLKPGGWAYVETVNRLSLRNVVSDIHFQLFGLNLLDHHRADVMYRRLTGSPTYAVSDFYEPSWYLNLARSLPGAGVSRIRGNELSLDYRADLCDLFARFRSWEETDGAKLDPFLVHEVKKELFRFGSRYFSELEKAHESHAMDDFHDRFSDPLLRFSMHKPSDA